LTVTVTFAQRQLSLDASSQDCDTAIPAPALKEQAAIPCQERARSWRELLIDIKQRGLQIAPDLAVDDGALGFWKAIEEVFPSTRHPTRLPMS
jgi:hypothetical protein